MQALLHSSHLYKEMSSHVKDYGIIAEGVSFDLSKIMAQKDNAVKGLTTGIEGLFKKNKVRPPPSWDTLNGPGFLVVRSARPPVHSSRGRPTSGVCCGVPIF